ncbi:MAG: acetamidase/formamidase family protein [Burkholderiales bacterium]
MQDFPRRKFLASCMALSALPLPVIALPRDLEAFALLKQRSQAQLVGRVHILPATPDTTQWGWFDNAQAPVLSIQSRDTVVMETMMAAANQILPGVSIEQITKLRVDNPGRGPHTITGPIYVEGAQPGDVLKIRINRIVPRTYGANWNLPGALKLGQFPDEFPEGQVRYFYFDLRRMTTQFSPDIEIPLRPFPGILGVARAEPGRYSTVPPGPFGGNMDIRELTEGTTLFLPVFVEGALLWSGDSHAAQGNGEINLTAIETAFNELSLTVEVIKGQTLRWPRIETPDHWIIAGMDRDLNKALEIMKNEAIDFLVQQRKITAAQAEKLLPSVADVRIAEVVNQVKGVYARISKRGEKVRLGAHPVRESQRNYVTTASSPDLQKAMDEAASAMIGMLSEKRGLSRLDAYSLASLTMDARVSAIGEDRKSVHCLVPKNLWHGAG